MKKILLLALSGCGSICFGQSVTPEVISTAGTSFTDGTNSIEWTLGEPATSTLEPGTTIVTQGFHQPTIIVTTVENAVLISNVSVFPNPTYDFLNIQFNSTQKNTIIELYSFEGKLIEKYIVNGQSTTLNMATYSPGNYFIKINGTETHRIVKSH